MLVALKNEKDKQVQLAIAHFVGTMIKHDSNTPNYTYAEQVLKLIFKYFASENAVERKIGTSIFGAIVTHQMIPIYS